jgi:hypothetical protein
MSLLDFTYPVEAQLSIVEAAINYTVSITNNILYKTDLNSPYRILVEAQSYIYNQYLIRLADVNYEITLLFFRILGFEARAARESRTVLKFELVNFQSATKYFRQGFPVRATNGFIFVTESALAITAGAKIGYVTAVSTTPGSQGNLPALTINQPLQQIDVPFSVVNEVAATEGQDGESTRELEIRVSEFIRKNGLITEPDYIRFIQELIPTAIASVISPMPSEIDVFVAYVDGTPLVPSDSRRLETELNLYKMLGISRLRINSIETLDLYIEVIASIVVAGEAQNIADSINQVLRLYLVPNNLKQSEGNQRGIIIVNEIERQLANTNLDFIQTIRLGLDQSSAYEQNFAFEYVSQRVRLGKLKVTLIRDTFTGSFEY